MGLPEPARDSTRLTVVLARDKLADLFACADCLSAVQACFARASEHPRVFAGTLLTCLVSQAIRFVLPHRKLAQTCSCVPFNGLPVLATTTSRRSPSACEILYDLDDNPQELFRCNVTRSQSDTMTHGEYLGGLTEQSRGG